ncbi:MAG: peptidoglycan-binding protein [Clostridiales bacterium]|nr:peptidoglycan-binding protein [Candidatus Crickella merdequi]
MMSSTIFRQYDSRWGSLPYPTKNSSFAGNGCGCCAVTHIAIENPKYAKLTPKDVRKYMVQYAVAGKGTLWSGIPAGMNKYRAIDVKSGLERYGYSKPVHIEENDPMSKAFEYMKEGYTMGIILFSKGYGGTTSRTYWTAGGHYIAFTGVRNLTSKDAEMYMKDSGGRCHDGWYSYLRSMKGVVFQMWLVKPIKAEKKPYSGDLPTLTQTVKSTARIGHACANEKGGTTGGKAGDQTTHEVCTGNFKYSSNKASHFHWAYMARAKDANARAEIAKAMKEACANNNIGYDTSGNDRLTLLKALKANGFKMSKIDKKVECDCSSLVRACCYCAGIKPKNFRTATQLSALKETGKFDIYSSAEYLTSSKHLKTGDILFKPNAHTCVVVSTGTSTTKTVSLKKGDSRSSEVKKLQRFLKWYGIDLRIDGNFGEKTESAVKKFQKNEGLVVDGHFGSKSLARAKKVAK